MGFALLLSIITLMAYVRVRNIKLLAIALGFFVFFIKGFVLTLGIFLTFFSKIFTISIELLILDFAILLFMYIGMVKK